MLSKATIKYINSLQLKKFRQQYNKFTAEGHKIVIEVLKNAEIIPDKIFCTKEWAEDNRSLLKKYAAKVVIVTYNELKKISALQTPNHVLVVLSRFNHEPNQTIVQNDLSLVLETIQDPGNFGTILRTADWFGIQHIFCSRDCVDLYNSKVIQASMGAFLRVKVIYDDLSSIIEKNENIPVYGAMLGGQNLFKMKIAPKGLIVIGNEGKGISKKTEELLTHQIEIPSNGKTESLNAAIATAIICAVFRNS